MSAPRALVVIPVTQFLHNNIAGARLAEALFNAGWDVEITSLLAYRGQSAELAFLIHMGDLFDSCGNPELGRAHVARLRGQCGRLVMWILEPAGSPSFTESCRMLLECGLDEVADNGVLNQIDELCPEYPIRYHHVPFGLTEREKQQVRAMDFNDSARVIPWSFIGYRVQRRIELVRMLVEKVDPGGLFYLTDVVPYTEHGPHIQDATFQQIMARTRYQLWRTHNPLFYMEGERYRYSALAGCVPIKIVIDVDDPGQRSLPFRDFVARPEELADRMAPGAFQDMRAKFLGEFCRRPSLEDELNRFLQPRKVWQSSAA